MPRMRIVKPGFFTDDELAEVSIAARMLFIGLWCIADREGRFEDRPKKIKAEVMPFDDVDVDELLQVLHDGGFIVRYEAAGRRYGQVRSFLKHQRPHHKEAPSFIPPSSNVESSMAQERPNLEPNGPNHERNPSMTQAWPNVEPTLPTQVRDNLPLRGTVITGTGNLEGEQEGEGKSNAVVLYEEIFGMMVPNQTILNGLLAFEETHSEVCIRHCLEIAAEADIRDWRYAKKILERHEREGCDDQPIESTPEPPRIMTPEEQAELDRSRAEFDAEKERLLSELETRTGVKV